MKVRLIFTRNRTVQYSYDDYVMEKQCKTVEVELPITNDDAGKNSNLGQSCWQIVGYEEIKDSDVEA